MDEVVTKKPRVPNPTDRWDYAREHFLRGFGEARTPNPHEYLAIGLSSMQVERCQEAEGREPGPGLCGRSYAHGHRDTASR